MLSRCRETMQTGTRVTSEIVSSSARNKSKGVKSMTERWLSKRRRGKRTKRLCTIRSDTMLNGRIKMMVMIDDRQTLITNKVFDKILKLIYESLAAF